MILMYRNIFKKSCYIFRSFWMKTFTKFFCLRFFDQLLKTEIGFSSCSNKIQNKTSKLFRLIFFLFYFSGLLKRRPPFRREARQKSYFLSASIFSDISQVLPFYLWPYHHHQHAWQQQHHALLLRYHRYKSAQTNCRLR